jgi:subtilisin family serine protease
MAVYIIRPQHTLVERTLTLSSTRVDSESRAEQIEAVTKLRSEDEAYQQTRELVARAVPVAAVASRTVASGTAVHDLPITGTIVADMDHEAAARIQQDFDDVVVLRDEPIDLIRPNRAALAAKGSIEESDLWHLEAIGLTAARGNGLTLTGRGVTVAVLDTGIDSTHPELDGRVAEAFTFDARPEVWTAHPISPSVDTDGHGTHVAGLVCGEKVGIAPGAKVINGMMIPEGRGNLSDFILALEWASRRIDIQIVNMSAGIPGYLPEMQQVVEAVKRVGVLPVFATGNEGRNRTRSPGNYISPLSVGACNRQNRVASFSSGGTLLAEDHQYPVPDVVAPGEGVYSCVMGGQYDAWDGTSMATPIVSGVAALLLEKYQRISIPELEDAILYTCSDLGLPVERQGRGLVQIKAVDYPVEAAA